MATSKSLAFCLAFILFVVIVYILSLSGYLTFTSGKLSKFPRRFVIVLQLNRSGRITAMVFPIPIFEPTDLDKLTTCEHYSIQ